MSSNVIINPGINRDFSNEFPFAFMMGSLSDFYLLCDLIKIGKKNLPYYMMSRYLASKDSQKPIFITGPMIGSPYAVMILENLIASGIRKIVFLGWCGAISPNLHIGDIVIAKGAFIDEGTSLHYSGRTGEKVSGSKNITDLAVRAAKDLGCVFSEGDIWTTDGFYRETHDRVVNFQKKGALAVEMELSALFSVGKFRNVEVCGILVVSDELSTFKWNPGFGSKRFKKGRRDACTIMGELWANHF